MPSNTKQWVNYLVRFSRRSAQPVRRTATDEEDPEQQLAFSNTQGSYFGSHFLMCGCRFDLAKPEAYLFGENSDLDLLGSRALTYPYACPLGSDEIRPLNALVNVRKESVKFVKLKSENGAVQNNLYQLHFIFDADCPCYVQIHFNAREVYQDGDVQFVYRNKRVTCSEKFAFGLGSDQIFNHFTFNASQWEIAELSYGVVQMQSTMCTVEHANDSSRSVILKPLRQKIASDGVVYLLQEIFGIENKENHISDGDDCGLECIICMSDVRDTVILPCRHLCICSNCADTLRYKLNNCPICRSPFRALIRLRAHRQTRSQIYETDSRRRHSSRSGGALHQVIAMEPVLTEDQASLRKDGGLDGECIEMTYISTENVESVVDERKSKKMIDGENGADSCDDCDDSSQTESSTSTADEGRKNSRGSNSDDDDFARDRRRSLQPGSRSSSSQLLNRANTVL
ncbi:unnamed protein product [Caenorhabditis auriculariae]|uniref:RING-type domain-containing protein n=1 Tax=Caenorhabditis auriculariae TaxID=2777116 RepID=A0A8S1GUR6_9PELO|nr:unnamed protein product [Caenorhabditis auriculariae]